MNEILELAVKHEHERKEREELLLKLSEYVEQDELEEMEEWSKEDLQDRLIIELEEALDRVVKNSRKFADERIARFKKTLVENGLIKEPEFICQPY